MAYFIYSGNVEKLEGHDPFGDGECVALVQKLTNVGHTSHWRPGPRVIDLSYLNPGTVIANFVFDRQGCGRFPNKHGYHVGLYMGMYRTVTGKVSRIAEMGQWVGRNVKARSISARGKSRAEGNMYNDSDNADQYYVVMH